MVKTKTKTPTLDSVRKVKSGVTELVLQNQKLKKKCRKLKKKVAKLETTSKTTSRNDLTKKRPFYFTPDDTLLFPATGAKKSTPYQQNIWKYIIWMGIKLDIRDGGCVPRGRFSKFINNIPPALMSRHAKSIAAGLLHSSVKPELNKRVMQEKIGVSVPTISQISRIINLI